MLKLRRLTPLLLSSLFMFACAATAAAIMTDKATGITFADKTSSNLEILGVGVRRKGPFKIYSVACYSEAELKEKLALLSRSTTHKQRAYNVLRLGARDHETLFELHMSFKVGAEKMASAIADSVSPRHSGDPQEVNQLKTLILNGVQVDGAATKGTIFQFACSPQSGVQVSVNGRDQGTVSSVNLAHAFCDVYLDDDCVSPALRDSCLENCCAE